MRILTVLSSLILIIACFMPWATIESKQLVLTGVDTTGTSFGKPAYFHFLLTILFMVLLFAGKSWTHKMAVFISAFNLAWGIRNFVLIPMCRGGECPEKHLSIYLVLISSVMMILFAILTPVREGKRF